MSNYDTLSLSVRAENLAVLALLLEHYDTDLPMLPAYGMKQVVAQILDENLRIIREAYKHSALPKEVNRALTAAAKIAEDLAEIAVDNDHETDDFRDLANLTGNALSTLSESLIQIA